MVCLEANEAKVVVINTDLELEKLQQSPKKKSCSK